VAGNSNSSSSSSSSCNNNKGGAITTPAAAAGWYTLTAADSNDWLNAGAGPSQLPHPHHPLMQNSYQSNWPPPPPYM